MSLNNILMLLFSVSTITIKANTMETLASPGHIEIATGFYQDNETKPIDIIKYGKHLLEINHLSSFIAHVEHFNFNPNHFITNDGYTALMLACQLDFKGDLIDKLLKWGSIYPSRDSFGVLVLLRKAIEVNNHKAVSRLKASKNITINEYDRLIVKEFNKRSKNKTAR